MRHGDALRPAILESDLHWQHAGAGLLHDVDAAFLSRNYAEFRQQEPSADYRVSGQFQLFLGSENAQACQRAVIGWFLHEDRFREVHFASDSHHLIIRQSVSVSNDGKRIALKSRGGENIQRMEAMVHKRMSQFPAVGSLQPLEFADSPFIHNIPGI